MRFRVQSLASLSVKDPVAMSCGVGPRHGLDPPLLWLWCEPVATAPIRPLAWEPPYAAAAGPRKDKKKKKETKLNVKLKY